MLLPGSPVLFSRRREGGQEEVGEEDRTAEDKTERTTKVVPKCSYLAALSCLSTEERAGRSGWERRTEQQGQ